MGPAGRVRCKNIPCCAVSVLFQNNVWKQQTWVQVCVNIALFMCILFSKIWFMNFRSRYGVVVSSAIWSFFRIIVMFWNSDASVIFCDFKISDCWFKILGQKNIVELRGVPIELMDYFVLKFRWKLFYQSVKTLRILKFFVSHYHTFGGWNTKEI